MLTLVPEKLLKIIEDIEAKGSVNLTRLTVLKKWFDRRERLVAFAVWVADRATSRKGKTIGEAATLFREVRALLKRPARVRPQVDTDAARRLHDRLRAFQNEFRPDRWGDVRIIHNWNLLLVEKSLAIYLDPRADAADGYKLAADYCAHYDPKYGNGLNGPSTAKIHEIVRFMFTHEALEDVTNEPVASKPKPKQTAKKWIGGSR